MPKSEAVPDLCVVGASEAGLAACIGAVALGLDCVLVDDGDPSGSRNPELALAALARAAGDPARRDGAWRHVAEALARAAPERRHARFGAMNVRLVRGTARFVDGGTLRVSDQTIRARRIFIAVGGAQPLTGLSDAIPPDTRLLPAGFGHIAETPRAVLVSGGSPTALSAAQSLARLGSRVTLASPDLLLGFDPELVQPLLAQMMRDGVTVLPARIAALRGDGDGILANLSNGAQVTAARILLADEPRPHLQPLDIARAGLLGRGDGLALDGSLRTNRRHIFAIGAAAGARSSAEGVAQAGHALRGAFFSLPGRLRPEVVATVTATEPQIGFVGRRDPAGAAKIWRWPLSHTGGAALLGSGEGFIKVGTDDRGRILSAGLVGPEVRELISFWTLAIARNLTLAQLAAVAAPTPSLSEAIRGVATQEIGRRLASPWVRRALRAARWLG